MKFRFLVDNKTEDARCMAEWGLSIMIESRGKKILFDSGMSQDLMLRNAAAVGVDLTDVDALVISHGHFDHTGGVPAFTRVNQKAQVYLHEDALYDFYGETDGKLDSEPCGIAWTEEEKTEMASRLVYTKGVFPLFDGITLIGNIPDMAGYPPTEQFHRRLVEQQADGSQVVRWEDDSMSHEQVLVIEEERGLYIFSGCSHRGVVPIIRQVQTVFPGKRIAGLIAGMHLYPVSAEERADIVDKIVALDMDCVFPVHCTGMEAIMMLKQKMGDKCVVASAGDVYAY